MAAARKSRLAGRAAGGRDALPNRRFRDNCLAMYQPLGLEGKVAVVIGGTSGIGRAIALGLAAAGADVVPCSRRPEAADAVIPEIEQCGRRSLRLAADVTSCESLSEARDAILA